MGLLGVFVILIGFVTLLFRKYRDSREMFEKKLGILEEEIDSLKNKK